MSGKGWFKELLELESAKLIKCGETDEITADLNFILNNLQTTTPGVLCLLFLTPDCYASQRIVQQLKHLLLQVIRRGSWDAEQQQQKLDSRPSNSPARIRKFFNGSSKKSKEKESANVSEPTRSVQVVVVPVDKCETYSYQNLYDSLPNDWWILDANAAKIKLQTQLLRCCRTLSTPSLTIIDSRSRQIILNDAKRALLDDLDGKAFPWWCPSPSSVFVGDLLSHRPNDDRNLVKWESLNSIKAIFFAANWCPPCKVFLPVLIDRYEKLRNEGINFDVIFVSSDRSESSFDQFFAQMPWLSLPFSDVRAGLLSRYFNVHGIPGLLILDETNQLISRHARNEILADPQCLDFPWFPKKVLELSEYTSGRLKDDLCFILFTEGSPEDAHFASGLLSYICDQCEDVVADQSNTTRCDQNGNESTRKKTTPLEPVQFLHAGDNDVVDQLMESLDIQDLPLPLVIVLDVFTECFYVCEEPDVSQQVGHKFLMDVLNDRVPSRPIPTKTTPSSPAHVGGIPMNAITAALGMSPSTMCMQSPKRPSEVI